MTTARSLLKYGQLKSMHQRENGMPSQPTYHIRKVEARMTAAKMTEQRKQMWTC